MSLFNSIIYIYYFFFFNDTATTEIYTLSLHDALPISIALVPLVAPHFWHRHFGKLTAAWARSEEHTSELQSQSNLVCRLLLEKKKKRFKLKNKLCRHIAVQFDRTLVVAGIFYPAFQNN